MNADEIKKRFYRECSNLSQAGNDAEEVKEHCRKLQEFAQRTPFTLQELDEEFRRRTQLTASDESLLFLAAGLQIARQYLLTKFPLRMNDQDAARELHGAEHSNRIHRYYSPSCEEVLNNPVPFDAIIGSDGALSGVGDLGHRASAIGHDPVLGLIVGTSNIATATITNWKWQSFHVVTGDLKRDAFGNHADTGKVFSSTLDKMLNQGLEGKKIVALSLCKEIIHLRSDLPTKKSLPLPVLTVIDPKLASTLASYGADMQNIVTIGKQMVWASLINSLIAMIHRAFYDGTTWQDSKLYEVRTRKILSYSNLIATSSNLAVAAYTKNLRNLDLGGLAVTLYRLISDAKFIQTVKQEFIFGSYDEMLERI